MATTSSLEMTTSTKSDVNSVLYTKKAKLNLLPKKQEGREAIKCSPHGTVQKTHGNFGPHFQPSPRVP